MRGGWREDLGNASEVKDGWKEEVGKDVGGEGWVEGAKVVKEKVGSAIQYGISG